MVWDAFGLLLRSSFDFGWQLSNTPRPVNKKGADGFSLPSGFNHESQAM